MPRAFGFHGDSAYHESLEVAIRASEAKEREEKENAEKESRASLGLPEEGRLQARISSSTKSTSSNRNWVAQKDARVA